MGFSKDYDKTCLHNSEIALVLTENVVLSCVEMELTHISVSQKVTVTLGGHLL